jgi:catechol 2,3-dioxygenase-like lactoylglutathione lyase family enzyme
LRETWLLDTIQFMMYEGLDSLWLLVPSFSTIAHPHERLGLVLSPSARPLDPGIEQRAFAVGAVSNLFHVQFLTVDPEGLPTTLLGTRLAQAAAERAGPFGVVLRVADLNATLTKLAQVGVNPLSRGTWTADGKVVGQLALLAEEERAGTNLVLIQYTTTPKVRHAAQTRAGFLAHRLPLRRLDHLALITRDLEAQTRFWIDVLGVPLAGQVTTETLIIHQFQIGDAVLELLAPASPNSPLTSRPPGLIGMASWEVADLSDVVAQVRKAGFEINDPAPGALPRTQTATVPGSELGGLTCQLLQYVG